MGTDSVRFRIVVLGRLSNFLLKAPILSMRCGFRPSGKWGGVGDLRICGQGLEWPSGGSSEYRTRECMLSACWYIAVLLRPVHTSATLRASSGGGLLPPGLRSGGEKCSVMSKSQQRRQLSPWQSPRPGSAVENMARDLFTAFCNPRRAREASSERFAC